jgi:protein TonB
MLPTPHTLFGGNLNDKAKSLPQPTYPQAARAAGVAGTVVVQVLIDEAGSVVSTSVLSGHRLLRTAAVQAARRAEFEPMTLDGQPKMISGVLTYAFQP